MDRKVHVHRRISLANVKLMCTDHESHYSYLFKDSIWRHDYILWVVNCGKFYKFQCTLYEKSKVFAWFLCKLLYPTLCIVKYFKIFKKSKKKSKSPCKKSWFVKISINNLHKYGEHLKRKKRAHEIFRAHRFVLVSIKAIKVIVHGYYVLGPFAPLLAVSSAQLLAEFLV